MSNQSSVLCESTLLIDEDATALNDFTTLLERGDYPVRAFTDDRESEACRGHGYFDFVIESRGSPAFATHREGVEIDGEYSGEK